MPTGVQKLAEALLSSLQDEHHITSRVGVTRGSSTFSNLKSFRDSVVLLYIDILTANIENRFAEEGIRLVMAASIFNPAHLPCASDPDFCAYGRKEIQLLANFYGKEVEITSTPILQADELVSEWPVFPKALLKEKETLMSTKNLKKAPSRGFCNYGFFRCHDGIFPQVYVANIILALPVGTATVERSFSQMKLIKTRPRNRLADENDEDCY